MGLWLYRFLLFLAFPLIAYSGWKRCRKADRQARQENDYAPIPQCFRARFGWNNQPFQKGGIWIHAVSVGETRSIFPLLTELKAQYPDTPITLTSGSTQGAQQALRFAPIPIQHQMIPYDYPGAVQRFLDKIAPKLVIMVETEIWPNLYQACHDHQIPLILANARIKEKSFQAYRKWGARLIANALNQTQLIASQFTADTDHLVALGVHKDRIQQLGNLKSDIHIPADLAENAQAWRKDAHSDNRFIWVAASTHGPVKDSSTSEEALMLNAHRALLKSTPDALLILVPRHTDRFTEVSKLLEQSDLKVAVRSRSETVTADTQIYLADTIGELMLWFQVGDVAFIGGSLVPFGGHNILEPAALGKPVLSGQYHMNLQALYDTFKDDNAVSIADDDIQLGEQLVLFAQNPEQRQAYAERAYNCFKKQSGALPRFMDAIKPFLAPNPSQTTTEK
jgi:3-deoxy-D-manno-octulosonic-acid transferase